MIPQKQIEEIREYLAKAENPLYFFDDDVDGLASYLLLIKKYEKGHGIPIKAGPLLGIEYLNKVEEYCPDLLVILDKANIAQDFIEKINVPILWIDHHPVQHKKGVHYYNTKKYIEGVAEPTTAICYEVTKGSTWIAATGILFDWYLPTFLDELNQEYPDLVPKTRDVTKLLFESEFGKIIKRMSFLLKGKTSSVKKQIYIFSKIESPYEFLNSTSARAKFLNKALEKNEKEYNLLLTQAKKFVTKEKVLLFIYPSIKNSYTAELSNELMYLYPDKIIIIGREKNNEIKMSLRALKIKIAPILENALKDVKGYGGGHDHACGSVVSKDDFDRFLENIKSQI